MKTDKFNQLSNNEVSVATKTETEEIHELSPNQQGLWFLDKLVPNTPLYSIPWLCKFKGQIQEKEFEMALQILWERHDILRSKFLVKGDKPFIVCSKDVKLPFFRIDLTNLSNEDVAKELNKLIFSESTKSFNLTNDLLMKVYLCSKDDEHTLFFNMHHIIFDGWSMEILLSELSTIYNALTRKENFQLPLLTNGYLEFAKWHREYINSEECSGQIKYWKNKLDNFSEGSQFPVDFSSKSERSYSGKILTHRLSTSLSENLYTLARSERSTIYMVLLSALKTLLYKYTNSSDLVVGSPMSGRSKKEFEQLIGYFVNLMVLRTTGSSEMTFKQLLKEVRRTSLEAYTYQDLPIDFLAKELLSNRKDSFQPFIKTVFAYEDDATLNVKMNGLDISPIEGLPTFTSKFDTTWTITNKGDFLELNVEYNTDLFKENTILKLMKEYISLLETISKNPDLTLNDYVLVNDEEKQYLLSNHALALDENLNILPKGAIGDVYLHHILTNDYMIATDSLLIKSPFDNEKYLLNIGKGYLTLDGDINLIEINQNGKLPEQSDGDLASEKNNLDSVTGQAVVGIWKSVLRIEEINPDDNFFELGGHSLLAIQIIVRLKETFGIDVPLRNLFEAKNIEEFIDAIELIVTSDIDCCN